MIEIKIEVRFLKKNLEPDKDKLPIYGKRLMKINDMFSMIWNFHCHMGELESEISKILVALHTPTSEVKKTNEN